jgi:phytoene dehydrogenase-like protein
MDEEEVISSFFKYLNVADGVEKEMNENGFGDIIVGSNQYHFPKGFDNVEKSLISYFPDSAAAVSHYIRLVKEVNEQTFYLNHKLPPDLNINKKFGIPDQCTLKEFLTQYHAAPGLIDLLGTFNYILMGSKADEVPFMVHAFVLGGYYQSPGVFTIKGINRLLSNFKRELARFGVNLFTNTEVDEILTGNDRNVIGVRTLDGEQYFSSKIIASFNPKLFKDKIKHETFRPVYRRRLDEAENTFGFYVAFYKIADDQDLDIDNFIYYNNDHPEIALGATVNRSEQHRILSAFSG